jgi:hypothetical protein
MPTEKLLAAFTAPMPVPVFNGDPNPQAAYIRALPPIVAQVFQGKTETIRVLQLGRQVDQTVDVLRPRADLLAVLLEHVPWAVPGAISFKYRMDAGDANQVINTWGELYRLATEEQIELVESWLAGDARAPFGPAFGRGNPPSAKQWRDALTAGKLGMRLGDWHRLLQMGRELDLRTRRFGRQSLNRITADLWQKLEIESDLEELNLQLASRYTAQMIAEPDTRERLIELAEAAGAKPGISDRENAAVVAVLLTRAATGQGIALDRLFEAQERIGPGLRPDIQSLQWVDADPPEAVAGAGSLRRLTRHPLKWAQRVFLTEPGKAIRQLGRNIMALDRSAPLVSRLLLRPAGVMLIGAQLEQVGAVLAEGRISAFDETAFMLEVGRTAQATGTAAAVAAPFTPPPFNVILAAGGALLMAGGSAILKYHSDVAAARQLEKETELLRQIENEERALAEQERSGLTTFGGPAETRGPGRRVLVAGGLAAAAAAALFFGLRA